MVLRATALLTVMAGAVLAADDGWEKVRQTKSGTELRIYKRGAAAPVLAQMDEATEESLRIVLKNEQTAIPKDEIVRIDYRPAQKSKVSRQTTTKTDTVNPEAARPRPGPTGVPGPSGSSSTSLSMGGKPDFELLWRRTAAPPKP